LEKYDFEAQPELKRDRIYVSWNEQWDLKRYAESYLQERNLVVDDAARKEVLRHIALCPAKGTLRKADVDYYLDVNARPQLAKAATPAQLKKKIGSPPTRG
jgi:hypothetical protein